MAEKYQNKYRIPSARAQWWDYSKAAVYFVTICTHKRQCFFGKVEDGEMNLSEIGRVVEREWLQTFEIRKDMNLEMGGFIIMPNHFHAIIVIGNNVFNEAVINVDAKPNEFGPQSKNLASIIRGFKSAVTKEAKIRGADFAWQPRYHDHIIRTESAFNNINKYIVENPGNWQNDRFFTL